MILKTFSQSIYKVGERGHMVCIPMKIVKELGLKSGETLYCSMNKDGNLVYSREKERSMPLGKYILNLNRTVMRVYLLKNWMVHNGLKPKDKVNFDLKGKNIIVSKPAEVL